VVGRNTPVTVYELLGFKDETLPPAVQTFSQGQVLYKQNELATAASVFATLCCREGFGRFRLGWLWVLNEK